MAIAHVIKFSSIYLFYNVEKNFSLFILLIIFYQLMITYTLNVYTCYSVKPVFHSLAFLGDLSLTYRFQRLLHISNILRQHWLKYGSSYSRMDQAKFVEGSH